MTAKRPPIITQAHEDKIKEAFEATEKLYDLLLEVGYPSTSPYVVSRQGLSLARLNLIGLQDLLNEYLPKGG